MSLDKTQAVVLELLSDALFQKPFCAVEGINWQEVFAECKAQSVTTLVFPSLPKEQIPEAIYAQWKYRVNMEIARNSQVSYAHTIIDRLFCKAEIPYVILKGCVSAAFYNDPLLRTMGDVDFLVKEADFDKADTLLRNNGFVSDNIKHEYEEAYAKDGIVFELHKKVNGVPGGKVGEIIDSYFEDVFEKTEPVRTTFAQYSSPSNFHHGLIMLLHVARHMITGGIGLRHFCDWAVFVEKIGDNFPMFFEEKLRKVGLWRFACLLTQFCMMYLGCSEKKWAGKLEADLLEALKDDIFAGGNFGHKDLKRSDEAKFITSRKKGGVNDDSNLKQVILSANEIVRRHWKVAEKIPLIYPFGWIFFGGRYALRVILGKREKKNIDEIIVGAEKRKKIYKKLNLYQKHKEEVE